MEVIRLQVKMEPSYKTALRRLAEQRADSNMSAWLRSQIRREARRAGLWPDDAGSGQQDGKLNNQEDSKSVET